MKIAVYTSLIFCAILFSFCSNKVQHKEKITSLDSIRFDIDKKIAVFNSLDTLKIGRYINTYNTNINWMKNNIKDTLSANYLNALKKYQNINEPLLFLKGNFTLILKDAETSSLQLKNLTNDLQKGIIEDEKAFEYYSIEKTEALQMSEILQNNYNLAKESIDTFEKYNNEIEKLITSYKSNHLLVESN